MSRILSFLLTTVVVEAGSGWGRCPTAPVVGDFDQSAYTGVWYEIKYDKYFYWGDEMKCVTATYSESGNENWPIKVENRSYDDAKNKTGGITGKAKFDSEGRGKVKFSWFPQGSYEVLASDYTSYAVVWRCDNFGLWHTK